VKLGRSPEACWTWLGPTTEDGHGKLTFCGRDEVAHRWLWEQLFGPLPKGWVVYSTCESKGCINPHHLAAGLQADANRSSVQTKLLPSDVAEIKAAKETAGPNTARMRTLNSTQAAKGKEQHLCPLQFDIVERCIEQHCMAGELVLDPFGGIGTVPYMALKMGRRGYGVELNPAYFLDASAYCAAAVRAQSMPGLFDALEAAAPAMDQAA